MIDALWCGVHNPKGTELHMFPVDERCSACGRRVRGRDKMDFVMNGAPSAPEGCVCRGCWEKWVEALSL